MKTFGIAGPINPEDNYYIPHRLDWNKLDLFLDSKYYFLIHAPRQSGKTTAILEYVKHVNEQGKYNALYITTEPAHIAKNDIERTVYWLLQQFVTQLRVHLPEESKTLSFLQIMLQEKSVSEVAFYRFLEFWSENSSKPLAVFFDEIDGLIENSLSFFLKQLRTGYTNRPKHFPQSVCLIGVRDLRDYRLQPTEERKRGILLSPFNIIAASLVLKNFTLGQVRDLYLQHTQETGQLFTDDAIECAYYLTQGQPWLVNALAYHACFIDVIDRSKPITKEVIVGAKEYLIAQRATHLDALLDKLNEERVRKIIDNIILGEAANLSYKDDDIQYVIDLGLISSQAEGLQIANPIYKEIIPATLAYKFQKNIAEKGQCYVEKDGSLNLNKLLTSFTQFFRENSQVWLADFEYKESGPHLLLMAFLQRIVNGGGKINREYALGKKRVDLLIHWKAYRYVIELKVKYGESTLNEGLEQTARYIDICEAHEGHLVIFDRDPNKSWDEKISNEILSFNSKHIHVWTM